MTLNVVRPAAVELAAPAVEVKAGATVEVKGKIVRKGTFKEPVTVKLNGLPAGLKADPVTVAAGAVRVHPQGHRRPQGRRRPRPPASVASAFQVNKKDYPTAAAPLAVKVLPAK